uniref:RRM domain-containing protein n=1 Tax=Heligmosomoides polygyrus TaxID=6339 RepID=A0A8L8JNS5_HELPZ
LTRRLNWLVTQIRIRSVKVSSRRISVASGKVVFVGNTAGTYTLKKDIFALNSEYKQELILIGRIRIRSVKISSRRICVTSGEIAFVGNTIRIRSVKISSQRISVTSGEIAFVGNTTVVVQRKGPVFWIHALRNARKRRFVNREEAVLPRLGEHPMLNGKHCLCEDFSVYVGTLPYQCTEEDVGNLFSRAGQVTSVRIVTDRETERPKGFGFCEFADEAGAEKSTPSTERTSTAARFVGITPAGIDPSCVRLVFVASHSEDSPVSENECALEDGWNEHIAGGQQKRTENDRATEQGLEWTDKTADGAGHEEHERWFHSNLILKGTSGLLRFKMLSKGQIRIIYEKWESEMGHGFLDNANFIGPTIVTSRENAIRANLGGFMSTMNLLDGWLVWAGNPNQEPGIGCTRQPAHPLTGLRAHDVLIIRMGSDLSGRHTDGNRADMLMNDCTRAMEIHEKGLDLSVRRKPHKPMIQGVRSTKSEGEGPRTQR